MTCSKYLVFDVETPSLKPSYIHMISIYDLVTKETDSYVGDEEIAVAIQRLLEAKMLVGHFIEGFDIPVISDLAGVEFDDDKVVDTLKLSRKLCKLPNHKLSTWGDMVGLPKLPHPDFAVWTPEMTIYCERDCHVTALAFEVLLDIMVEQNSYVTGYGRVLNEYVEVVGIGKQILTEKQTPLTADDMPY